MSKNTPTTGSPLCAETKKALGLLKDTISQLEAEALTLDELSRCNAHQNPFGENTAKAYSKQIEKFQQIFRDRWNYTCSDAEIGGLYVPRPRGYSKTLLVMPPAKVIAGMEDICIKWRQENKFPLWTFADGKLNERVPNDRRHKGMYALLHKGEREADKELLGTSFEGACNSDYDFMRGTEVLFFEDCQFQETGEHNNHQTTTITSSLDSGGSAVGVGWFGEVYVDLYGVRDALPNIGPRAAVYL